MRLSILLGTLPLLLSMALPVTAETGGTGQDTSKPDELTVRLDLATVVRMSAPAATIIIGNPGVADATLPDSQTLVITGRSAGTTNIIALDAAGEPISETMVAVLPPDTNAVTIYRQSLRFSHVCAPDCDFSPMPGDPLEPYVAPWLGGVAGRWGLTMQTLTTDGSAPQQ